MTLNEFETTAKVEIDRFVADWKTHHSTEPIEWPLEMPEGDWFEQYLMFMTRDSE